MAQSDQPADPIPALPPDIRRKVEQAIESAKFERHGTIHPGTVTISAHVLAEMLRVIDALTDRLEDRS